MLLFGLKHEAMRFKLNFTWLASNFDSIIHNQCFENGLLISIIDTFIKFLKEREKLDDKVIKKLLDFLKNYCLRTL